MFGCGETPQYLQTLIGQTKLVGLKKLPGQLDYLLLLFWSTRLLCGIAQGDFIASLRSDEEDGKCSCATYMPKR